MENFVVSARKYRPASFDMVVGQSHITTTLKNAIKNNHLAQAFLFCGPRGVGKTTCARILAKTINCTSLTAEGEACNECESCKSFNTQSSFNIHELDAASNNSVDDIRNLVDQVRFPPQSGKYKIYIIDEVRMLSSAAFNAFLKTLEEPPAYAKFILATTEKHKILPTILSRCQIYDFNRIGTRDMAEHLSYIAKKENIKAEDEALNLIAQKADGGLRDALSMFDLIVTYSSGNEVSYAQTITNLHILDYDYYFKATDAIYNEEMTTTLLLFDEILKNGFDGHNFILGLTEHFRNLLVCKDPATVKLLEVSESIQKKYLDQAKAIPDSFLLTSINIANQCDINYKVSKNQRLHVELALMKLVHIKNAIQLAQSMLSGVDLKKKADSVAPVTIGQKNPEPTASPVIADRFRVSTPKAVSQPAVKLKSINTIKEEIESGKSAQSAVSGVEEPETASKVYAFREFTPEALLAVWQELAELKKKAGKMTEFTILDREYKLEGTKIHLSVENALLQEDFTTFRHELLDFLRSRLDNGTIDVTADIATTANTRPILFNSTEKFKYLAEKYPILEELQRRLGLELDY